MCDHECKHVGARCVQCLICFLFDFGRGCFIKKQHLIYEEQSIFSVVLFVSWCFVVQQVLVSRGQLYSELEHHPYRALVGRRSGELQDVARNWSDKGQAVVCSIVVCPSLYPYKMLQIFFVFMCDSMFLRQPWGRILWCVFIVTCQLSAQNWICDR